MDQSQDPQTIKLVVVGDGSVGKTCILLSYTTDKFPTDYVPTVFENYTTQIVVDGKMINLSLWDTAGQEGYSRLRTLSYGQADVFVIVYSVVEQSSFDNALNKWYAELSNDELKKVPKIIVGNKIDMRNNDKADHIKEEAARQVVEQNCKYYECSALTQEGLKPLFDEAIRLALQAKLKNGSEIQPNNKGGASKNQAQPQQEEKACCIIS